eukprot:760664-Hanusia_phi.AAC.2
MMIVGGYVAYSRLQVRWPFAVVETLDDYRKPSPLHVMEDLLGKVMKWLAGLNGRVVVMFEPGILFPSLLMSKMGKFISPSAAEFAITQRLLQLHIRFQPLSGNFPSFRRYLHLLDASLINSDLNYEKPSASIQVEKLRLSGNNQFLNLRVIIRSCSAMNSQQELVAISWKKYERRNEFGDSYYCDIHPQSTLTLIDDVRVDFMIQQGNYLQSVASLCFHLAFLDRKSSFLFNKGELDEFQYILPFESFEILPIPPKQADTAEEETYPAAESVEGDHNTRQAELSSASTRRNSRDNVNALIPSSSNPQEGAPQFVSGLQEAESSDDDQFVAWRSDIPVEVSQTPAHNTPREATAQGSTSRNSAPLGIHVDESEDEGDEEEDYSAIVPLQFSPNYSIYKQVSSFPKSGTSPNSAGKSSQDKKAKSPEKQTITNFDDPKNFEMKLFNDLMDSDRSTLQSKFALQTNKGSRFGQIKLRPRLFSRNMAKVSEDELMQTKESFQMFLDEHIGGSFLDHSKHMKEVQQLWKLTFPLAPVPPRPDERWKKLGFQGTDPITDLRAMGTLSIKLLCYMAQTYSASYHEILRESTPENDNTRSFPFACAGINMCYLLIDALKVL